MPFDTPRLLRTSIARESPTFAHTMRSSRTSATVQVDPDQHSGSPSAATWSTSDASVATKARSSASAR